MLFVIAGANLLAANLGIEQNRDLEAVRAIVNTIEVPHFEPKSGVKIQVEEKKKGEEEKKEEEDDAGEDDFKILDELKAHLSVDKIGVKSSDFHPADFEKDDDSNFHIDFIHATA